LDAADLFCLIFDDFEAEQLDPYEVDSWMTDQQVIDISSFTEGQVVETGTLDENEVRSGIEMASDDPDRRRFAYLQGIDNALLHAHPHTGSHDTAGLTAIAVRYAATGKFNTDAVAGALLPRFAFPADDEDLAVERLADAMTAAVRVPSEAWEMTDHTKIATRSDFHRLDRENGIVFGCVPFVEDLDELDWERRRIGEGDYFRASVIASEEIKERIAKVLALLDRQGAMVGVVPEACLSDQVLEWWRQAITGNRPPRDSRLRWIFVGTGPIGDGEPPANTGLLLDRYTGDVLMTQDKLYPFLLGGEQIEAWGLAAYVGEAKAREDIRRGESVTIAETGLGRLSVLICEDLARTMELGPPLRSHGLSHAIAPVFSNTIQPHHWEHNKAKEYADQVGTQVVVANSRAVGRARGEETFGTALAHSPHGTEFGATSRCDEVVLLRLSDEAAILATPVAGRDEDYDETSAG
jgi:predicted amidohydrolase